MTGDSRLPLLVGIVGFDDVEALDLLGPFEALSAARVDGAPAYRVELIGLAGREFRSESGISFTAAATLVDAPRCDLIIVPGGAGLRAPANLALASSWLKGRASETRRIASVCTGIYALAEAGLLDGRRATTHWRFAGEFSRRYPAVTLDASAVVVRDGHIYTSAGVTTGIDLALALIRDDHGPAAALKIARELVMPVRGPAGQAEFSDNLLFETRFGDRLASLGA